METHDGYYMGDRFYYRRETLDGLQSRFFIYDLREDMEAQMDFIYRHGINSFSFTGEPRSSLTGTAMEDSYHHFLTVIDQLPFDAISLNLTHFEVYDNLDFLKRFSDCRRLTFHCVLESSFNFQVLEDLSHVSLWYGKNFESILQCPRLKSLCIFKPDSKALLQIGSLEHLQTLAIRQAHIKSIEPLAYLHSLESLELRYLSKITSISPLTALRKLKDALFQSCTHVEDWDALDHFRCLESLVLENCGKVDISKALEKRLMHLQLLGNSQRP